MADVTLRARTEQDAEMLFRVLTELDSWEQRSPAPPRPVARPEFERRLAAGDYDGDVHFVIESDGTAVGRCTLTHEDALARTAELGIAVLPEACGHGVGTAALRALAAFAFERRNLRRLHLAVLADNAAAIASYRKVGFVEEGRRREHGWVRGAYVDELVMGLLRSEWRGREV